MKRYVILAVIIIAIPLVIYASHSKRFARVTEHPVETVEAAVEVALGDIYERAPGPGFEVPYEPVSIEPKVAAYKVDANLRNVVNRDVFGEFTPEQTRMLAQNGFFVAPTDEHQLFFIYEQNDYLNIPSFITTDSVLQVYHIFYGFTLRNLESGKLHDVLRTLTDGMMKASNSVAGQMTDPKWKKAAEMNQVYFAVAGDALGLSPQGLSSSQRRTLDAEAKLIKDAQGRMKSALFPFDLDYSQFIPRGHYTREDKLKEYFRAMMWYGLVPLPCGYKEGHPVPDGMRQAVLITHMLFNSEIGGSPAIETWERIYEPTAFYVGASDDLTPYQFKEIMDRVYGPHATYAQLQDEGKLKQFGREVMLLPGPQIDVQLIGIPGGHALKFMGQRYIPDSEIMQELVEWPVRTFPRGLDVMAVLGSERAADILDNFHKDPEEWEEYVPKRTKLLGRFSQIPQSTWQSNLYWGWLWGLQSLLDEYGDGYPSFMTNQAWLDKSLTTALGSWAELRHDTILYAKQSGAQCGGDEPDDLPLPMGYVEPNVEFYNKLLWLTKASREGLDQRELLSDYMRSRFTDFEDLLTFLKNMSIKHLTNQKLTQAEYEQIRLYGANLENLTTSVIEPHTRWFEIVSETDKNMAVIADVHTSMGACLEVGVGHANQIFVVVPIEGKLYLTRGAVFSYYEFEHPSADRLTDEKWQQMLKDGTAPSQLKWTDSFLAEPKSRIPIPRKVRSTGC